MATTQFECGCEISKSMFGEHEILRVSHCPTHRHLFNQDKSLKQMAKEIIDVTRPD